MSAVDDRPGIGRRELLALCLLCLAFFIAVLGSTSVFTAGPAIQADLGLTQAGLQWTFTAATLPAGALLLVGGRLADLFGRRRMFMTGLALLVVSSLACGLAPSAVILIGARVVQGIAGAVLMPAALSLVMNTFPSGRPRTAALATWSAIGGIGATAGLLLGGLVTQGLGWQWVFWINVPVGLVTMALSPVVLREPARQLGSLRIDVPGTVTITLGLALVVYGITMVPERGWFDVQSALPLGLGLASLAGFAWVESHSDEPIVPARLLRSHALVGGNLVLVAAGMCVDGLLFTLTLFTQKTLGYSALQFGLVTAIMTTVSVGATYLAQRAMGRFGTRPVATTGLALLGLTCLTFAGTVRWGGTVAALGVGMLLFGLGMGGAFVAGSVASLADVPEADSGIAAGLQNISFSLGATLGVATLSTVAAATASHLTSGGTSPRVGAAGGQQAAFVVGAVLALAGCLATRVIPRGGRPIGLPLTDDAAGSDAARPSPREHRG